jgi:hypothetical protein
MSSLRYLHLFVGFETNTPLPQVTADDVNGLLEHVWGAVSDEKAPADNRSLLSGLDLNQPGTVKPGVQTPVKALKCFSI